jgi:hypothetical protein
MAMDLAQPDGGSFAGGPITGASGSPHEVLTEPGVTSKALDLDAQETIHASSTKYPTRGTTARAAAGTGTRRPTGDTDPVTDTPRPDPAERTTGSNRRLTPV